MDLTHSIKIANRQIGVGHPPFVIAEMSGNHNQSLERALQIVEAAAHAGAHALKLQTYTANTITLDIRGGDFEISIPIAYGQVKISMIFIPKHIHHGRARSSCLVLVSWV